MSELDHPSSQDQQLAILRRKRAAVKQRRAFVTKYIVAGYSTSQIVQLWNNHVEENGEGYRRASYDVIKLDRKVILREINERYEEELKVYRGLLIERYEIVIEALFPMVRKGNLGAIDRYLKTLQQIGDVTGANAPMKLEVENTTNLTPEERQRRVMDILRAAQQRRAGDDGVDEDDDEGIIDVDVEASHLLEEPNHDDA